VPRRITRGTGNLLLVLLVRVRRRGQQLVGGVATRPGDLERVLQQQEVEVRAGRVRLLLLPAVVVVAASVGCQRPAAVGMVGQTTGPLLLQQHQQPSGHAPPAPLPLPARSFQLPILQ
jgi:hypothetical protein